MSNDLFSGWFGALAVLTGAACGSTQASSKVEMGAEVGDLPAELEDDYRVFAVNCSKCHGLERPLTAPVTDHKHWERYVAKMMRTPGSGISTNEAPQILAFLFWYTDRRAGRANGPEPTAEPTTQAQQDAPLSESAPTSPPEAPRPALVPADAPQGESTP